MDGSASLDSTKPYYWGLSFYEVNEHIEESVNLAIAAPGALVNDDEKKLEDYVSAKIPECVVNVKVSGQSTVIVDAGDGNYLAKCKLKDVDIGLLLCLPLKKDIDREKRFDELKPSINEIMAELIEFSPQAKRVPLVDPNPLEPVVVSPSPSPTRLPSPTK